MGSFPDDASSSLASAQPTSVDKSNTIAYQRGSATSEHPKSSDASSLNRVVRVSQLRFSHVPTAVGAIEGAFETDALKMYMTGQDGISASRPTIASRIFEILLILYNLLRLISFQVLSGRSFVIVSPPPVLGKRQGWKGILDDVVDTAWMFVMRIKRISSSDVAKRRRINYRKQQTAVIEATIGDRTNDMYCIETLATHPDFQGRGYAGTLMKAVAELANSERRSVWLVASGPQNVPFYTSHGYKTVGQIRLGDDDETWKGGLLVCDVMVKEYSPL
ncbi:hypothetical protein SISNIDRAFT_453158 [Sistotremastrum niveocremeum HHB9708]|uniref:N-acetyltransferase domain-containing protein n=2 Tax=Sistotremastraceae TaxID=3402574 RepID=A0A164WFC2_9AGAM|nr:hypothetical protein SISNIDRAFT_453158 [Sistotremastrum niveocremeum HHB9708]KZT34276.1 hypothetical protein SISSUDRAFT_1053049 [Sistotremastrum suecicum HHB10207 ss-3]